MSGRDLVHAGGRIAFAVLGIVAMAFQFGTLHAGEAAFSAGNFFSFFTIQSNIAAAAVLLAAVVVRRSERGLVFEAVRGAATLYIVITGVVFAVLLSGLQESLDTHISWVNTVVHKLIPIVLAADWLIDPPWVRLPLSVAFAWLSYPAVWLGYTLIRGASVGWYPYPFVDVDAHGYGGVAARSAVLLVFFVLAALAVAAIGNALGRRRAAPAAKIAGA